MSFSCHCYLVLSFILLNDLDFYLCVCATLPTSRYREPLFFFFFILIMSEFLVGFSLEQSYLVVFLKILHSYIVLPVLGI